MKKTISTMAAAAVLMASTAIAPAMAQTSDPAAPASPAMPSTESPAVTPAPDASSNDNAAAPAGEATTDTAAAGMDTYITEQSETQISANDYIGKAVYNAENESIGNVNDLIMEEQGGIVAAVIGVGGFLGIGEKSVAVPIDNVTMTRDAENNNEVRLATTETTESLQGAPEFKTLQDQQAEADSAATDATTTSSTDSPAMPSATTPSTSEPAN